jgi:hypothetical protein
MNSPIALVLVNSAIAFVLAFATIIIIAAIARYLAGSFASEKASRIAAFGVAIGYALGHFPGGTASTLGDLPAVSTPLGAVAGLITAWAWLLRKGGGELSDVES